MQTQGEPVNHFYYSVDENHFTDHETLSEASPSGAIVIIHHGTVKLTLDDGNEVTIGRVLSFEGKGLAVDFAPSYLTGIALGIPTMTTILELLERMANDH